MILKPHTLVAEKELGDTVYVDFVFDVFMDVGIRVSLTLHGCDLI